MFNSSTDREWEKYGATDPYFGVFTHEKYRKTQLTQEDKAAFFRSGHDYLMAILSSVRTHLDPAFHPSNTLDFGCGVGRLVIPLAAISENVVGLDISSSMLNEAKLNCDAHALTNVSLIKSDDELSSLQGKFDFIHSIIVFQHIPVKRGVQIFKNLLTHLADGGICVLHFTFAARTSRTTKLLALIKTYLPLGGYLINLLRGRDWSSPNMQMNSYDLNKIFLLIQEIHVNNFYAEYTDHGGYRGLLIYFKGAMAAPAQA